MNKNKCNNFPFSYNKNISAAFKGYAAMMFIIFIFFGNSNNSVNCIKFFFRMTPNSNKCLGEYLTSNTVGKSYKINKIFNKHILFLAIFSLTSEYSDLKVKLFDPNGNIVYSKVIISSNRIFLYLFLIIL